MIYNENLWYTLYFFIAAQIAQVAYQMGQVTWTIWTAVKKHRHSDP